MFRNALVIGASGGVGNAVAKGIERMGGDVTRLSRAVDGLDLKDEHSIESAALYLAESGRAFDLIFIATGVLDADSRPEKSFEELTPRAMAQSFAVNTVGPALAVKHFAPLLSKESRSVFAALSARVGSVGDNRLGGWMSYRASKAALNQIMRCAAIEVARTLPAAIVVALHPGTIETPLTRAYARGRYTASPDEAAAQMLSTLARMTPDQSGGFYAYDGQEIAW